MADSMKIALILASYPVIVHSCSWTQEDTDTLVGALIGGCVGGIVIALIVTVLPSLPLCCGVFNSRAKIIAGVSLCLGLLCCLVPAITGFLVGANVVDKACSRCGTCTDADRTILQSHVGAAGVIVAYVAAFGWVAVILGIIAATLSCCVCCGCCKMREDNEVHTINTIKVVPGSCDEVVVVGQVSN